MLRCLTHDDPQTLLNRAAIAGYIALIVPLLASAALLVVLEAPMLVLLKALFIPVLIVGAFTVFWLRRWFWGMGAIFLFVLFNIGYGMVTMDALLIEAGYAWLPIVLGVVFGTLCLFGLSQVALYRQKYKLNNDE